MKREIRTTLVLDGEQKFKQELQAAAREMRILKSETRANTLAFGDNAKSVDALTIRNQGLARQAEQQREIVAALSRAVEEAAEKYGEADRRTDEYRIRLNNARAELARIENEIRQNNKVIAEQTDRWKQVGEAAEKAGKKMKDVGKDISRVGDTLTKSVTVPIMGAAAVALKASIDFESAWAGVQKTVDGTEAQLAELRQGIIDMSRELPASTKEIAAVAEAAGQLGIETDNILKFTRTMIDLGETTNIVSAEAAKQLAQFANVTQMSQRDFDRLGSVIVELGNNFATTEADIVNMAQRLAGAGKQIGLTNPQIMAFATTLSSVGIAAEAGGSAFSRVFSQMQLAVETGSAALNDFARVAGMSADQFARTFRQDAAGAVAAFITGLSKMNEQGISSIKVLQDMNINELRLRDTLLRTSNAGELVTKALAMADKAWEENIALTKEANLRYATTESQLKMVRNEAVELARQFGDAMVPVLKDALGVAKDLIRGFADMTEEEKKSVIAKAAFAMAIGPVISGTGRLVQGVGGAVEQFGKLSKAISNAGGIAAVMSGPAGWVTLGVVALGGLVVAASKVAAEYRKIHQASIELNKSMKDANKAFADAREEFNKTSSDVLAAASLADDYIDRLEELERTGLRTAESQREYQGIVERLRMLLPELNIEIDEQTGLIAGGTDSLRENTQAWKENAVAQALQKQVTQQIEAHTEALVELTKKKQEYAKMEADIELTAKRQAEIMQELEKLFREENWYGLRFLNESFDSIFQRIRHNSREQLRFSDSVVELIEEYNNLDRSIKTTEKSMSSLSKAINKGEITVAALAEELNITEAAAEELMEAIRDTGPIEEATQAMNELAEAEKEAGEQASEMAKAYEKAADKTTNVFDRIKNTHKISVQEMIRNLEFNQKAVEEWATNLEKLAERGLDQGLLEKLREAGPEARVAVANLVKASDKELQKLNEVFQKGANMATEGAREIGKQAAAGFAQGIEGQKKAVEKAAKSLAQTVTGTLQFDLQIASPSKVAYQDGKYYVEGLVKALEDGQRRVRQASAGLASSVAFGGSAPAPSGGSSGGASIHIHQMNVRNDSDIRRIAQELYALEQATRRPRGWG